MNLVRLNDLANIIKISKPTIYKYIKLGMPVHYIEKIPFFDLIEVDNWFKNYDKKGE